MTQSVIQIKEEKDEWGGILLPISRQFAQTVELDLVDVKPMGRIPKEELDPIVKRIEAENRESMIESIESDDYIELIIKKIEDDQEYQELAKKYGPNTDLFYLDYKYGDDTDDDLTRRL